MLVEGSLCHKLISVLINVFTLPSLVLVDHSVASNTKKAIVAMRMMSKHWNVFMTPLYIYDIYMSYIYIIYIIYIIYKTYVYV